MVMRSILKFVFCVMLAIGFLDLPTVLAEDAKQIDINKATVEELAKVPGLNMELAKKVVERRKENGEFVDLEELLDIEGIDNTLLRSLKKYLIISAAGSCNC
jgi:competence protein ComEA